MSCASPSEIHPTAVISKLAEIAEGVKIGPHVYIGDGVEIGSGTTIGPSTVIEGPTKIGQYNRIYGQASIGTDPQDLKYQGEKTALFVGDNNIIREFVTINRGTEEGGAVTRVGSQNLLMTGVHIAHDCEIGDGVILANAATLAGHIMVEDGSTVGAFSGVHQFCRVGRHAFIGGYSVITRDALPFVKTVGTRNTAKTYGINVIGLKRKGFSDARIGKLKAAYRALIRSNMKLSDSIGSLREEGLVEGDVKALVSFIESSKRGFIR